MKILYDITVTSTTLFRSGTDEILVQVSDLPTGWYWRLVVNEDPGRWHGQLADLITHKGYGVVTEYWLDPNLEPWHPFRLDYAAKVLT